MNYSQDQLKNALSSEYVLGTLSGRARLRYQRLLMEENNLLENVWHWENKLNQLGTVLPPQKPHDRVWLGIQNRLGFGEPKPVEKKNWWQSWLAPGFALASVFFLTTAWLIWQFNQQPIHTERVAVVQSAQAEALWLIEIKADALRIQATPKLPQLTNQDYQLWMIAKDGRPPIPLGLLPQTGVIEITRSDLFNQLDIAALAVSREPLGGSPTGQPTEVLYTTELVNV